MMIKLFKVVLALPALLFIVLGLRWLVDPAGVAPEFGFALADGLGRSSQVGDMTGYFLTLGVCILMALVTGQRLWFYPAILLLLVTAVARVLAWVLHEAAFAGSMIAVEVVVSALLLSALRWLPQRT